MRRVVLASFVARHSEFHTGVQTQIARRAALGVFGAVVLSPATVVSVAKTRMRVPLGGVSVDVAHFRQKASDPTVSGARARPTATPSPA
jgi:hypothetical protein